MLDFFERQDQARLNTARLLPYMIVSMAFTTGLLYALCIGTCAVAIPAWDFFTSSMSAIRGNDLQVRFLQRLWIPELFYTVAALVVLLVVGATILRFRQLRKGGWFVAIELGGKWVDPQTQNTDERRLRNVVEEMSIASSTPVPEVYILPRENSINAFAAGHSTDDAAIGVTSGALHVLDRQELQGVIAHEFSHILNGDMRLNMRLGGIVHGVYSVTLMSYAVMDAGRQGDTMMDGRKGGSIFEPIFALGGLTFGFLLAFIGFNGALCGRVIKSAVCREREFLADAAAVQFTRYPDGLAGALKKAEAWSAQRITLPAAEQMSHIFFNNLRDDDQLEWTATHPPVAERIKRLDPQFNKSIEQPTWEGERPREHSPEPKVGRGVPAEPAIPLDRLIDVLNEPALDHAAQLLASLPEPLLQAARQPVRARALIFALLTKTHDDPEVERLRPFMSALDVHAKLPLVELAFPALRGLLPAAYTAFRAELDRLIESDQQIDLFEFALQKMVSRHLDPHFKGSTKHTVRHLRLKPLAPSISVLLCALAHAGQDTPEQAEAAFRQSCTTLGVPADDMQFYPLPDCNLPRLNQALDELHEAAEGIRNLVLNACLQVISADNSLRIQEAELLRAIADSLGCAIPPLILPRETLLPTARAI